MIAQIKDKIRWFLYRGLYKPGHYYSPVPSWEEVAKKRNTIFAEEMPEGIDLRMADQEALLQQFRVFSDQFSWPEFQSADYRYYWNNTFFNKADAFALFGILRHFKPRRIIEIGSGFSSALMLDVNDRFAGNNIHLTFIEPFPARLKSLLKEKDNQACTIIEQFIQDVPPTVFDSLEKDDILFIDSSHISKVGSDVNYLFFKILPRLAPGVLIHIHDICFPFEYPADWIQKGIYWNEAYLLRSFLMYNHAFQVTLFNNYWKSKPQQAPPAMSMGGGSIWLKRAI